MDDQDLSKRILASLQSLQDGYSSLAASVRAIEDRLSDSNAAALSKYGVADKPILNKSESDDKAQIIPFQAGGNVAGVPKSPEFIAQDASLEKVDHAAVSTSNRTTGHSVPKIILTTYPGQSGIDPIPLRWGNADPTERGPVAVSRAPSTIRRRNGMLGFLPGKARVHFAL